MENQTKKKRFYKVNEMVWVIDEKKEGKVKAIDRDNMKVTVTVKEGKEITEHKVDLWKIDKLKYKAKAKLVKAKKAKKSSPVVAKGSISVESLDGTYQMLMNPEVFYAKVKEHAVAPSKREEDAGFDLYACVDGTEEKQIKKGEIVYDNRREGLVIEILCPAFKTTLVPTGIATALPKTHFLDAKHERGSTGKVSMSVLAGVVDSGYRGEIFIAMTPLHKDVIITNQVTDVEENDTHILYPYSKAIAQATIEIVPKTRLTELSFEDLQKIESERGDTKLGQSGK